MKSILLLSVLLLSITNCLKSYAAAAWDTAFQEQFGGATGVFYSDYGSGGRALASYGGTVYAVVQYGTCCGVPNFLAKWTGGAWQALPNSDVYLSGGSGPYGKITCIAATATD